MMHNVEQSSIHWGALNKFILLPIFLLAIFFLIRNYKKIGQIIELLVHRTNQKRIFSNFSQTKQRIKLFATITGLSFLFIAILQPQWHKKEQVIQQDGRDLLIMLDISRSMLAQDMKPNRLEFVKLKLKTLLKRLEFERVGLILFSGSAFVQCPLTSDYSTFSMFLDHVDVENIASGTTAIDAALKKMIETYKQYPDHKSKLALLVTDGEDFSLNLKQIKDYVKKENIKLFALGAGTKDGAPVPKIDPNGNRIGHETNEKGEIALSRLDEKLLREICADGYVRATYNDADIDYIVKLINKFEKETFGDKKLSLYEDQYPWFLGTSWLFFALAAVL